MIIRQSRGSWLHAQCAVEGCETKPRIGFDIDVALNVNPIQPRIEGEKFTCATFTPCSAHEQAVRAYLVEKGFADHTIRVIPPEQIAEWAQKEAENEARLARRRMGCPSVSQSPDGSATSDEIQALARRFKSGRER